VPLAKACGGDFEPFTSSQDHKAEQHLGTFDPAYTSVAFVQQTLMKDSFMSITIGMARFSAKMANKKINVI